MSAHTVTRGLDHPIAGAPAQVIHPAPPVAQVALLPADLLGIRPRLQVQVGDSVQRGQVIYQDRTHERIRVVAPAPGRIAAVNRGDRRVVQSVVIDVAAESVSDSESHDAPFATWREGVSRDRESLRALLLESGLWTAFRTRPFSHVPLPDTSPSALFVTAMDTQPLAPDVDVIIDSRADDFAEGLTALANVSDAPVHVCRKSGSRAGDGVRGVQLHDFAGKHPAGTPGYHIHVLAPVSRTRTVWHIGAQDVIRIGHLVRTGRLDVTQVVALGGPMVREPRLLRTILGASVSALVEGELTSAEVNGDAQPRVLSGSVLTGRRTGDGVTDFLGRFHQQISVLPHVQKHEFLGWVNPFSGAYTHLPIYIGTWAGNAARAFDTRLHGGQRAMVPIGSYERVMPMDIMPTHLLRAITVGDVEWAEELGVLELDEEDVALCTFVCPGKYEYGSALRSVLDQIVAEQ